MAVYLLAIGLKDYVDRNFLAVHCCENDAVEIHGLFKHVFGLGNRAVRLSGNVLSHQLWDALDEIGSTIRNGDTFILFFAGHGYQKIDGNDQLLLLYEARSSLLKTPSPQGVISLSALKTHTDKWMGVSRIFILDACRTWLFNRGAEEDVFQNEAALSYLSERDLGWPGKGAARAAESPDLLILNATRNGEIARKSEELGQGILAYALQEVLEERRQNGRPIWLDKQFAGELAQKMTAALNKIGLGNITQTPFLTPPNGRVLLHKPLPVAEREATERREREATKRRWQPEKTIIETPSVITSVAVLANGRYVLSE